jgi:hypothetical protein
MAVPRRAALPPTPLCVLPFGGAQEIHRPAAADPAVDGPGQRPQTAVNELGRDPGEGLADRMFDTPENSHGLTPPGLGSQHL